MLKKILFCIVAIATVLTVGTSLTSCEHKSGTVIYSVNTGDFFDNMDVLKNAIEKGFEEGGMKRLGSGHNYILEGEVNSCNNKAKSIFKSSCEAVDKDRSKMALPLAIKGVTVKLMYTYGGDPEAELTSYTFVEEDK